MDITRKQSIEYARAGLTKNQVEVMISRAVDINTGKVYQGEAGRQLLRRQKEKQDYYERNR